ncbi:hypothetical protein Tco_1170600 [Tanacetum coccineum]
MDTLEEFKITSGLTPSLLKSTAYFCNMLIYVKLDILNILPFEKGKLLVKYLGVPLVPSCLLIRDCTELMEKVKRRINDWKNKSLSLAGRQLMRGFLWCQGEIRKGKAKVAWEAICLRMKEGGLGIRRLKALNKALISSHIWSLLTHKESLWVKWIHTYKLNGRTLWEIPLRRDGRSVSAWFANGCPLSPFADFISNQDIYSVGFSLNKVWEHVKRFMSIPNIPSDLSSIVDFLIPLAKMRSARSVIIKLVFAASYADCPDVESSLEAAFDSYWAFPLMVYVRMGWLDCDGIVVHEFDGVWKVECLPIVVLFFPSLRFFPMGFSWEGFLRRQNWLAVYTSMLLHRDDFEELCTLK